MLESSGLTSVFNEEEVLLNNNSEKYRGEWSGKKRHGKGKVVYLDGGIYEGYWLYDQKNGFGRQITTEGGIYIG